MNLLMVFLDQNNPLTQNWLIYFLIFPSVSLAEGPVEIGMSLDIASIDAISEINMVDNSSHFFFSFSG